MLQVQLAAKQAEAETLLSQVDPSEEAAKAGQQAGDKDFTHTLELKLAAAEEDVSLLWVAGIFMNCPGDICRRACLAGVLRCLTGLQAEKLQQHKASIKVTDPGLLVSVSSTGKHAVSCS